ncbi:hypothetical protein ACFYVL_34235 [Streptomyces sp. NPDC004111]|uniref:hypothetical protein n=1 Tax=Streptomyces sp. NPDC004111 TaxID=3364690 RepID=UPI0036A71359
MTMQTRELFDSLTPRSDHLDNETVARAVDALLECEQASAVCARGMLAHEAAGELEAAINRDLDCADVAAATRRVLARGSDPEPAVLTAQLEACVLACERSFQACNQHARNHAHCRICSEVTAQAGAACQQAIEALRKAS